MLKKSNLSKEFAAISSRMGKAIGDYDMFQDGDKVLVAVSGGKDSLSLLRILQFRQSFIPIKMEFLAVFVDSGIPDFPVEKLESVFKQLDVPYRIEKNDFLGEKSFEDVDCFWCSWNRRKVLFGLAQRLGFNKIAFGHHLDDIVETVLLNLFYQGEIGAMKPKQELFEGKMCIVRPLAYEKEENILIFAKQEGLDGLSKYYCPQNDKSKRMQVKKMLAELEQENPAIKINIFKSLQNIKEEYLLGFPEKAGEILKKVL
ncbi:MAG: ATP-binding protein [Candidatus Aceula meridiana]|nr:ATP-binding protein [Candidatus Aceula meridiana]